MYVGEMNMKNKDYCTGFFDKIGDTDISGCCLVHDEDYADPNVSRKDADIWLRK